MNKHLDIPERLAPLDVAAEDQRSLDKINAVVKSAFERYAANNRFEDLKRDITKVIEVCRQDYARRRRDDIATQITLIDEEKHRDLQEVSSISTLDVKHVLTGDQFEQLCRSNREMRLELTAKGELIIMPPTGSKPGLRNASINYGLSAWSRENGSGICFDSSTGFILPNGARRSPDGSWIRVERWEALAPEEQEGFAPLCPDFVIELCSRTDKLSILQDKMVEYLENGAQLGWLIDPLRRRMYIYRPNMPMEMFEDLESVSGDPVLPGFVLNLRALW